MQLIISYFLQLKYTGQDFYVINFKMLYLDHIFLPFYTELIIKNWNMKYVFFSFPSA